MNKFDHILIGDKAEIKHTVTQEDLEKFVELTGDDNKLHTDRSFVARTTFKKPVVHGMLGASFISTIIGTKLPGDGALWFAQSLEFLLPVRIGDELLIRATVIKKMEKLETIELQTDIFNQDKQLVTTGIAKVKIVKQEIEKNDKELEDDSVLKCALVIGATGGIGRKTCVRLAKCGFSIIVHYFENEEVARLLKQDIEKLGVIVHVIKANIIKEEDIKELADFVERKIGHLTVLVNCASSKIFNLKFENLDWAAIDHSIEMNVMSNFLLVKHFMRLFIKHKYGKIVFLTTQAIEEPNTEWLPYITAKSALHGFAKALALELAPKGIRVNMVSPGMTETNLIANISEKDKLVAAAKTPLRRIAKPEDIAEAICFLAGSGSDFITGETIRVNGGKVML